MIDVLKNKEILILERDQSLSYQLLKFLEYCRENKLCINTLYSIQDVPFSYIQKQIDWFDVIVYQTTWTYEISHKISEYLRKNKSKKIVIECYMSEPSFYRKPKGVVHDMYNWTCDHDAEDVFSTIDYEKLKTITA